MIDRVYLYMAAAFFGEDGWNPDQDLDSGDLDSRLIRRSIRDWLKSVVQHYLRCLKPKLAAMYEKADNAEAVVKQLQGKSNMF